MNFEDAVDKALNFAKRSGYHFARLVSAEKDKDDRWNVMIDVGAYKKDIKVIQISHTGVVSGFK